MDEQKQDKKQDVTTNEIMEFLQEHMVMKDELKQETGTLRQEIGTLRQEMITKSDLSQALNKQKLEILDAVDDKLVNLKGDLISLVRKGDTKVVSLIELLKNKKIITTNEANGLLELEPFPQLILGT